MNERVTVDLTGGRQQEFRLMFARKAKAIMRAKRPGFHCLDRQVEISCR
jgi:hypothetical protein